MPARLIDVAPKVRWAGSRALVPIDRSACPMCGGALHEVTMDQPALFRHGGYGATTETHSVFCLPCGWGLTVSTTEVRPARLPVG